MARCLASDGTIRPSQQEHAMQTLQQLLELRALGGVVTEMQLFIAASREFDQASADCFDAITSEQFEEANARAARAQAFLE
jgi:hypothetical protein